jgi:hypothetical protein
MKNLKDLTNELIFGDAVKKLAELRSVGLTEARILLSEMSFKEYRDLEEATITPPSGNTITPTAQPGQKPSNQPTKMKAIWPGQGAPTEVGMTVGVKGPNGLPVPGEISKVDQSANGVMVKNPTTGQNEWMNIDDLEPFMAQGDAEQPAQQTAEQKGQIARLRELAGIRENCSAGATGAGAIAIAPTAMGSVKKRQPTDEEIKKEYTPKRPAQTIVGDTKPSQASGELSSSLAVRGKKTASRSNNGRKR